MECIIILYEGMEGYEAKVFLINTFDPWVATDTVHGKKMTIICNVDNIKISHAEAEEVTNITIYLNEIY